MTDKNINRYTAADGGYVVYHSPIARKYAVCRKDEDIMGNGMYDELTDYVPVEMQPHVTRPEDYTLLTVLPNNVCNFHCSYCYSASGRNGTILELPILRKAIEFFIESKPVRFVKPLTISFMGGGEPMLSWETVMAGIEYAEKLAADRRVTLHVRIITNGSVLTDEALVFMKNHNVAVSVSFEILRDVQELQRKHYDLVRCNIHRLLKAGIDVQINATVTPANVDRMRLMYETLRNEFPEVTNAMFEPVTGEILFESPAAMRDFYNRFRQGFIDCLQLGEREGVSLTCFAYLRTIYPIMRACPGEFCLTPQRSLTACYCVASPIEPLYGRTVYGHVDANGVSLNKDSFDSIINVNIFSRPECTDCEVRWSCGGGCFHQMESYSKPYREEVCNFTRNFVRDLVLFKTELYLANHGDSLPMIFNETF